MRSQLISLVDKELVRLTLINFLFIFPLVDKEQQVTQKLYICHPNIILFYLAGLAVVQIPEFDMSVAHGNEVRAVLGEGHTCHLTGHLVGSHHHILL